MLFKWLRISPEMLFTVPASKGDLSLDNFTKSKKDAEPLALHKRK